MSLSVLPVQATAILNMWEELTLPILNARNTPLATPPMVHLFLICVGRV